MNYKGKLETSINNRQSCSVCGRTLPKDVQRISMYYRNRYGGKCYHRVCGLCIIRLSEYIDRESIKKWMDKEMVDEL